MTNRRKNDAVLHTMTMLVAKATATTVGVANMVTTTAKEVVTTANMVTTTAKVANIVATMVEVANIVATMVEVAKTACLKQGTTCETHQVMTAKACLLTKMQCAPQRLSMSTLTKTTLANAHSETLSGKPSVQLNKVA